MPVSMARCFTLHGGGGATETHKAGILKALDDLLWESGNILLVTVALRSFVIERNLVHVCGCAWTVAVVEADEG